MCHYNFMKLGNLLFLLVIIQLFLVYHVLMYPKYNHFFELLYPLQKTNNKTEKSMFRVQKTRVMNTFSRCN